MSITLRRATRQSVPLLIGISSVSGGGKTYSALLMAAGLAGPKGRVAMIDTEQKRGLLYADSPGIKAALPNGYEYAELTPPFSPDRYTEYIAAAEQAGIDVCVIDSFTHEWEGIGGCVEIAEKNPLGRMPNWSKAKMAHKRLMNHILSTKMHIILCIRAREKVKVFKRGEPMVVNAADVEADVQIAEKDTIVSIGLQPVTEKNVVFECMVSLQLAESTHHAVPIKVPEPLASLFPGGRLVTREDGERIRLWNETGAIGDPLDQLKRRARTAAEDGMESYKRFFAALSAAEKKSIAADHEDNKRIASTADSEIAPKSGEIPEVAVLPDPVPLVIGTLMRCNGRTYATAETADGIDWMETTA